MVELSKTPKSPFDSKTSHLVPRDFEIAHEICRFVFNDCNVNRSILRVECLLFCCSRPMLKNGTHESPSKFNSKIINDMNRWQHSRIVPIQIPKVKRDRVRSEDSSFSWANLKQNPGKIAYSLFWSHFFRVDCPFF